MIRGIDVEDFCGDTIDDLGRHELLNRIAEVMEMASGRIA